MELLLIGTSHHLAPVAVREKVSLNDEEIGRFFTAVGRERFINECLVLSTCNRIEIYASSNDVIRAAIFLRKLTCQIKSNEHFLDEKLTYFHTGWEVVHHLFRVACSLDSQIVGENQILSQIKHAYTLSIQHKSSSVLFNKLLHRSLGIGKRARAETGLGRGAVSISRAAVELAEKVFGDLKPHTVLLIGAGETANLTAGHLIDKGVTKMLISNRTHSRAEELARDLNAEAIPFEQLDDALVKANIVISSTGASEPIINHERMRSVMHKRGQSRIFMIDIAVPRDLDPKINKLGNVMLNDIDDLKYIVERNIEERRSDIPQVEKIIHQGVVGFSQWQESLSLAPTIKSLSAYFENILHDELERSKKKLRREDREQLEPFVKAAVKKLIHNPIIKLKEFQQDSALGMLRIDTVRSIFDLDSINPDPAEKDKSS